MTLTIATDILFQDDPDFERLRYAAARAFGVQPEQVTVSDAAGYDPIPDDVQVLILHNARETCLATSRRGTA